MSSAHGWRWRALAWCIHATCASAELITWPDSADRSRRASASRLGAAGAVGLPRRPRPSSDRDVNNVNATVLHCLGTASTPKSAITYLGELNPFAFLVVLR